MQWFAKIFSCGKLFDREDLKMDRSVGGVDEGLVSEETEAGEMDMIPAEEGVLQMQTSSQGNLVKPSSIRLVVQKEPGQLLGLRLFKLSLEVQSIEPESPLSIYQRDVPMGSLISNVNGVVPTLENVKHLLRECRDLPSVCLVFLRPPCILPLTTRQRSLVHVKRASYSSNSSSRGYSPTPSQLSTMWRRVSETGSNCCQLPPATTTPPQSMPEGVTAIDFSQLSRDFPKLWTRGRGSLPAPRAEYDPLGDVPLTERMMGLSERASTSLC